MPEQLTEQEAIEKAEAYLKHTYGEDTVRMDVLQNDLSDDAGSMTVECTVSVGGRQSDWRKTFYFEDAEVQDMSARHLR